MSIEMQKLCHWAEKYANNYGWRIEISSQVEFDNAPQLVVFDKETDKCLWDAICHRWSYGGRQGLLEIMGTIVDKNVEDEVEGYLTCDDVITRIHSTYGNEEE